nr:hypothetical protein [uncultured Acetobacterium sp.]
MPTFDAVYFFENNFTPGSRQMSACIHLTTARKSKGNLKKWLLAVLWDDECEMI